MRDISEKLAECVLAVRKLESDTNKLEEGVREAASRFTAFKADRDYWKDRVNDAEKVIRKIGEVAGHLDIPGDIRFDMMDSLLRLIHECHDEFLSAAEKYWKKWEEEGNGNG